VYGTPVRRDSQRGFSHIRYTGGQKKNPTYEEVPAGGTGHAESVQVVYGPAKVTYEKLLSVFWHNIDPTVKDRQFCDSGHQYRSAIFYHNSDKDKRTRGTTPILFGMYIALPYQEG
jgi:methionine-S-sulfoxide reductase